MSLRVQHRKASKTQLFPKIFLGEILLRRARNGLARPEAAAIVMHRLQELKSQILFPRKFQQFVLLRKWRSRVKSNAKG